MILCDACRTEIVSPSESHRQGLDTMGIKLSSPVSPLLLDRYLCLGCSQVLFQVWVTEIRDEIKVRALKDV